MLCSIDLRWWWKSSTRSVLRAKHVSSTYPFQKWGGEREEVRALDSTSSITRLATNTELGNP